MWPVQPKVQSDDACQIPDGPSFQVTQTQSSTDWLRLYRIFTQSLDQSSFADWLNLTRWLLVLRDTAVSPLLGRVRTCNWLADCGIRIARDRKTNERYGFWVVGQPELLCHLRFSFVGNFFGYFLTSDSVAARNLVLNYIILICTDLFWQNWTGSYVL